jgi:hypothetical protein
LINLGAEPVLGVTGVGAGAIGTEGCVPSIRITAK